MLAIILVMIGSVGASSGLMLWGTAMTMNDGHDLMYGLGVWSMIIGAVLTVVGGVMYRSHEKKIEASLHRRND
jgi:hypothetical protein